MIKIMNDPEQNYYDKARAHFMGHFPESLPIEQAYVHIGIYLGWIIENSLYSEYFKEEASSQIFRFTRREISCTILSELWEGCLGFELFNRQGNLFTGHYYASGLYLDDYQEILAGGLPSPYHVDDTWENYEQMKARINMRILQWRSESLQ